MKGSLFLVVFMLLAAPSVSGSSVDGREWMQPATFAGLSWNDINEVCPIDGSECNGLLNGVDVTGWTWAGIHDVNALFNSYLGQEIMKRRARSYSALATNVSIARSFFDDFQRTREGGSFTVLGLIATTITTTRYQAGDASAILTTDLVPGRDTIRFNAREGGIRKEMKFEGAWLYRSL